MMFLFICVSLVYSVDSTFVLKRTEIEEDEKHIEEILKLYADRTDIENIVKVVSHQDIAENDYNLSVSTYVEKKDTREKVDIIKLNAEIKEIVSRVDSLRKSIDEIVEEIND